MTEHSCHAHVRPQAPATEAPPPTVPVRNRDLVAYCAYMVGLTAMDEALAEGRNRVEAFERGWALTASYFKTHDRRRSAVDEML